MRSLLCFIVLTAAAAGAAAAQSPGVTTSTDPAPPASLTAEQRADVFIARREYQAALDFMDDAVRRHEATPGLYNRIGIAHQQLLDFGQAERNYKLAIKREPKRDPLRAAFINNLGTVYYQQHNYGAAAKQFNQAIKLQKDKAPYYVNLGGAEFARKHYAPAMSAYQTALRLDPNALFPDLGASPIVQDVAGVNTAQFHYSLSRLFCTMGMVDDSLHQFRQALELHYAGLKGSLTDPAFAPLRSRPEYRALMDLPPAG